VQDCIVMVTDLVQSTSLARMVGNDWPAVLARHDEIIDRACTTFAGRRSGGLVEPPPHLRIVDLGPHEVRDLPGSTRLYRVEPRDATDVALGEPLEAPGSTPLFGRQDALDALRSELAHSRVVSVVGPGGIGKTRLATELHRTHAGDSVLVDLSRLAVTAVLA
jgi:hypothetical protein